MPLNIRYTVDGYFADVTPWPGLSVQWANDQPLTADELIGELQALGIHQQDIGDAFEAADPGWLQPDR